MQIKQYIEKYLRVTNITMLKKIIRLRKTRKRYTGEKKRYHTVLKTTKMAFNLEYLRYWTICLVAAYMYFKQQSTEEKFLFTEFRISELKSYLELYVTDYFMLKILVLSAILVLYWQRKNNTIHSFSFP